MKQNTTPSNIYDIIIENVLEEFKMDTTTEKWEIPKYSKSEINKAGKIITNPESSYQERDNALTILNNWRASHAYPLQVICNNLRLKNPNAIVVQRLKRLESISGKLERFPDMSLYRMQDLGGCRVIVESIDQVYEAVEKYKKSRIRHILKRENDYIQTPKDSGYRSYHMAYQFYSDKKETYNKNIIIEIQFRTKLQHTWATAVEMMGIFTKSQLKSSQGDNDILRFFTLVSSIFAKMENMPVCPNTSNDYNTLIKEIKDIDKKHNIISALSGLNVFSINYVSDKNSSKYIKNGYYILILNYEERKLRVRPFKSQNIEKATRVYGEIENKTVSDTVLVSANSFDTLKAAYPNYFVDIRNFVEMMRRILS